jgi:hypothetical protein
MIYQHPATNKSQDTERQSKNKKSPRTGRPGRKITARKKKPTTTSSSSSSSASSSLLQNQPLKYVVGTNGILVTVASLDFPLTTTFTFVPALANALST